MSDVYVAVYKAYRDVEDADSADTFLLGVFSDHDKAVTAFESAFDEELYFHVGVGMAEFIVFVVEIEKTAWAVERGWHKVAGRVIRVVMDSVYCPLTKAEQERDIEALAEEYGRAADEYESEAHK